ncbi:unnamed protein product [Cuscuta campestris]|uniref:Retrotransposon gag domain-containing protein n=1 Tax=Cuscuta campestris TaxID=132261 RepID=A0A484MLK6_9ASTE|nr:unnamed protein product [Cuscuta campestris]
MSNESQPMSHEELVASNAALKVQVEYLAKEVANFTKIKLNALQGSDHEDDASTSGINKTRAPIHEGSNFKVDIPTFDGKNDPDEFPEWLETVERVFDFKDVSDEKNVKIVALKFRKYASTWWTNTGTKRRRNGKEPVSTWTKMRSLLKKKFLPAEYVRENFSKLQTLKQGSKSVEDYHREFEELFLRCDLQEDDEQTFVLYLFGLNLQIANTVELQSYETLEELTKLALKVEAQIKKSKALFSKPNPTYTWPNPIVAVQLEQPAAGRPPLPFDHAGIADLRLLAAPANCGLTVAGSPSPTARVSAADDGLQSPLFRLRRKSAAIIAVESSAGRLSPASRRRCFLRQ